MAIKFQCDHCGEIFDEINDVEINSVKVDGDRIPKYHHERLADYARQLCDKCHIKAMEHFGGIYVKPNA